MNRAIEIINSLRAGMDSLLKVEHDKRVNSLRMFNFEKNRVSLRMEIVDKDNVSHPMGMIDVIEYPTGDKRQASCNCQMTELASGKTERLVLKLDSQDQKKIECTKVFNFFRKVLHLPEIKDLDQVGARDDASLAIENKTAENINIFPPPGGELPNNPRGAQ